MSLFKDNEWNLSRTTACTACANRCASRTRRWASNCSLYTTTWWKKRYVAYEPNGDGRSTLRADCLTVDVRHWLTNLKTLITLITSVLISWHLDAPMFQIPYMRLRVNKKVRQSRWLSDSLRRAKDDSLRVFWLHGYHPCYSCGPAPDLHRFPPSKCLVI